MDTYHEFKRCLVPFTDFDGDDDTPTGMQMVCKNATVTSSYSQLFITALMDHLSSMYFDNSTMQDKLFKVFCEALIQAGIMLPAWKSNEYASIRHMYQKQFVSLVEAAIESINSDMNEAGLRSEPVLGQLVVRNQSSSVSSTSRAILIPSKLKDEFTDIENIGKGAYGKVYKAVKKSDGQRYAVKEVVFKPDISSDIQSAFNEVRVLASLSHSNVVRYYDNWVQTQLLDRAAEEDDCCSDESTSSYPGNGHLRSNRPIQVDERSVESSEYVFFQRDDEESRAKASDAFNACASQSSAVAANCRHNFSIAKRETYSSLKLVLVLYIQMELCDETLKDWIEEQNVQKRINDEENRGLFKQILEGVDYIHGRNLIHRDLKPQNIFLQDVNGSRVVKIGDFGLATLIASKRFVPVSKCGKSSYVDKRHGCPEELTARVGTALYSSPEQSKGSKYDEKSDMYSLGVILFELYRVFGTVTELTNCISGFHKTQRLDDEIERSYPLQAERVKELISVDPNRRPSAKELLQGELFLSKDQIIIADLRQKYHELCEELRRKDAIIDELAAEVAQLKAGSRSKTDLQATERTDVLM